MPYITGDRRETLRTAQPSNAGELNYKITELLDEFICLKGMSYETLNAAVGAVECAKQEFLRRVVAPYEDTKIKLNGDVYQCLRATISRGR